jgi:hydroxysqualene dehydroxylase
VEVPPMSRQRHVIVIGGGFAGLSCATVLAGQGFQVTVLEGRQVLGGRAYSFKDPQMGDSVDNGQHLFMGCYRETQTFLERIGALHRLVFQPNLSIEFRGDRGRRANLFCWPLPSPWHLLSGLIRLKTLSWADRFRLIYFQKALKDAIKNPASIEHLTVEEWLVKARQSERARRHLWDLIAIATLNEDPRIAAASPFVTVLAQAFFDRRKASRLGLAAVGLSDLYAQSAKMFIELRDGHVHLKSPVAQLEFSGPRVTGVLLRDGRRLEADWVVSAVAPTAFLRLLPESVKEAHPSFQKVAKLAFAPIISIHLWFDREISKRLFVGLLDTQIQWFFNKSKILGNAARGYVSLVISGAHGLVDWSETKLLSMALEELRRLFPKARAALLLRSLIIKEHQATLSPTVGSESLRPEHQSPYENFLIAGDWTRTGLPATIESACISGHVCADLVIKKEMETPADPQEVAYA